MLGALPTARERHLMGSAHGMAAMVEASVTAGVYIPFCALALVECAQAAIKTIANDLRLDFGGLDFQSACGSSRTQNASLFLARLSIAAFNLLTKIAGECFVGGFFDSCKLAINDLLTIHDLRDARLCQFFYRLTQDFTFSTRIFSDKKELLGFEVEVQ